MRQQYFGVLAGLGLAGSLAGCAVSPPAIVQPAGSPPIHEVAIASLPGWSGDNSADALAAFIRGCKVIDIMPADQSLGGAGLAAQAAGQAGLWQNACRGAQDVPAGDDAAAKAYFSAYFDAYQIDQPALITGYFEPEYPGSKNAAPGYGVPLYAKPDDPVLANLPRAGLYRRQRRDCRLPEKIPRTSGGKRNPA